MAAGQITATGTGGIALSGSGVPSPAPATQFDLNLAGTTISSAGGEIKLVGDRVNLATSLNSGSGRTMIVPFTTSRLISLGGIDEIGTLNLSNGELSQVSASVIVVGGGTYTGGLSVDGAVNINPCKVAGLEPHQRRGHLANGRTCREQAQCRRWWWSESDACLQQPDAAEWPCRNGRLPRQQCQRV
jgi:hypothetical protein